MMFLRYSAWFWLSRWGSPFDWYGFPFAMRYFIDHRSLSWKYPAQFVVVQRISYAWRFDFTPAGMGYVYAVSTASTLMIYLFV